MENTMTIESNTFAEACYDMNTISELRNALKGDADEADMITWGISADEWRRQVRLALAEKRADEAGLCESSAV